LRSRLLAAALLVAVPFVSPLSAQNTTSTSPVMMDVPRPAPPAPAKQFFWVADATFEYGGDVLVTLLFDDGSEQDILAGQGGTASFGFDYRPARLPQLGLRTMAGIKFTSNASDNADISFIRFPIEVVGSYYLPNDWRVGAGLAYHVGNTFNGDGFVNDVDFDPAAGATLEVGWKWVALTYTTMEYSVGNESLNANAFGVSLNWVFGKRY
jgi:hypothetical protein